MSGQGNFCTHRRPANGTDGGNDKGVQHNYEVPTTYHEILRVIPVLATIIVVYAPNAIVAVNPKVLCNSVVHLGDGTAGAVLFRCAVTVVDAIVCQVRLSVPAVELHLVLDYHTRTMQTNISSTSVSNPTHLSLGRR